MPLVCQPFTLTNVQYRVLAAFAKAKGDMNRNMIMDNVFGGNSVNLRPILEPLVEERLIRQRELDIDGRTETVFSIMARGRKAVENAPAESLMPGRTNNSADHTELPAIGETFSKIYNGQEIDVTVVEQGFFTMGKVYTSLSAAAKAIRQDVGGVVGEVNGWAFFGFTK
jgi:hypothetical protein